jgi:hypothetical protein
VPRVALVRAGVVSHVVVAVLMICRHRMAGQVHGLQSIESSPAGDRQRRPPRTPTLSREPLIGPASIGWLGAVYLSPSRGVAAPSVVRLWKCRKYCARGTLDSGAGPEGATRIDRPDTDGDGNALDGCLPRCAPTVRSSPATAGGPANRLRPSSVDPACARSGATPPTECPRTDSVATPTRPPTLSRALPAALPHA